MLFLILLPFIALRGHISALDAGDKVDYWIEHPLGNPEELGDFFEGDIVLPNTKRAGIINTNSRWPNGRIPYEIVGNFPARRRGVILRAMKSISSHTCIKFVPKTVDDTDYVRITSLHNGCYSYVGKIGGPQTINLQSPGCLFQIGTAIHELVHAVGFYHEQSRHDRDDHVDIIWENVKNGTERNFKKYNDDYVTHYGIDYDYGSVMHYSGDAFSKNGKHTISAKGTKRDTSLGQRYSLSKLDVKKINAMYNCTK